VLVCCQYCKFRGNYRIINTHVLLYYIFDWYEKTFSYLRAAIGGIDIPLQKGILTQKTNEA